MECLGFIIMCLLSMHFTTATLLKHLAEHKPGGLLDRLKNPKIPGVNIQLGGGGARVGIGSFGFGFGYGGQYAPSGGRGNVPAKVPEAEYDYGDDYGYSDSAKRPGTSWQKGFGINIGGGGQFVPQGGGGQFVPQGGGGQFVPQGSGGYLPDREPHDPEDNPNFPVAKPVIPIFSWQKQFGFSIGGGQVVPPRGGVYLPPKKPQVTEVNPHYPDSKPEIPDVKPHYPDSKPELPDVKPQRPGIVPWENEQGKPRPNWEENEDSDQGSYKNVEKPKMNPYEESKEDFLPDWEDIGEASHENPEPKADFNDGDLVGEGFIQPRKRPRSKRFIESHVYHVPLLFQSNAKPFQVKVQSKHNSIIKEGSEK